MSRVVLDASALLALFYVEPGSEKLTDALLESAVLSAVNAAEVQAKLVNRGVSPEEVWRRISATISRIEPFTAEHAKLAGSLVFQTRSLGLSLGDRCCLALAIALKAPVYTADKVWKSLKVGIPVHLIR